MELTEHATVFTCSVCEETKTHIDSFTTGYGVNDKGEKVCFNCCGKTDSQWMKDHDRIDLYLTKKDNNWVVSNWPGTLRFFANVYKGRHNWAGCQYTAYFKDEWGNHWFGRRFGDNTEIVHCQKMKG
jgi:hypothetical protein